jgi:DNA-directed RNA polymerase subunit alpha
MTEVAKAKKKVSGKEAVNEGARNIISANWTTLIKPSKYVVEDQGDHTSTFKIEPLERGLGITLGNSLRRVLLSSLQGAAITSLKIEGVDHEYSTVQGVREDVTDMILNLKQVSIKYAGTDINKKAHLKVEGPCVVTAGMITAPHDVEIINKDLVICHLDRDSKLNIEFAIATGKGYVPANENARPEAPLGVIPVDSIYTPVKRVSFRIENSRVGSETEYDKLYLTIQTNGTLSPELALGLAAKIMQDQLQLFISFEDIEDAKEEEES